MKIQKRLDPGTMVPRGYGLAWHDWINCENVYYPIPLNWVMCYLRKIHRFLVCPPWSRRAPKDVIYWRELAWKRRREVIDAMRHIVDPRLKPWVCPRCNRLERWCECKAVEGSG